MTKLIALLAVAALSGCVVAPYYPYGYGGDPYGGYYGTPYYGSSISIYGSSGWGHGHRFGRDRDGDGVPNRRDAFPNDPTRR